MATSALTVLGCLNLKVKSRKKHSAAAKKREERAERAIFNSRIKLRPRVAVLFFTPCFFPLAAFLLFSSLIFFVVSHFESQMSAGVSNINK